LSLACILKPALPIGGRDKTVNGERKKETYLSKTGDKRIKASIHPVIIK
jgi:hypothetical protein